MRQKAKRFLMFIAGICLLLLIMCSFVLYLFFPDLLHPETQETSEATTELFAMDTYITMTAYGPDAVIALTKATDKLTELEQLWSVTDVNSDIYAVNHSGGQAVSDETVDLLSFALQMAKDTDGALEPTIYPVLTAWGFTTGENRIPSDTEITALLKNVGYERVGLEGSNVQLEGGMMLDLGAVGKGYSGDLVAQVLRDNGITSALLDIGGNIQAVGTKPDGSPWRLGLRDPFSGGTLGVLEISNMAVVTSGNCERYFIGEDGKQYGHIKVNMGPCTSCDEKGYVMVVPKGDSNHGKRVVCGSCETYVDELITKEDAAGESRTWCADCWADYDALMGN